MNVKSQFAELLKPEFEAAMLHAYGKHAAFKGQRYRRGKNRCSCCGAPNDAKDIARALEFSSFFKEEVDHDYVGI